VSAERGGSDVVEQLADEWRELCSQSENDEPFYRPEWIGAYLRAFEPTATVLVITVRREGRLQLVLPLVEERCTFNGVPVRKLRAPANSHPGRFDFVCLPGRGGDFAIHSAWTYLRQQEGWDLLELASVPENGASATLVAVAQADGFPTGTVVARPNPCIFVPDSPGELTILPRNARLRTKLRQVRRKWGTGRELNFRCMETPTHDALARFYELEGSGWKGQEQSSIKSASHTLKFYNEVADSAGRFGYFALYMLEWNGKLIAAHFSLRHRGRCYSPKVAYDEQFERFAPGHLIIQEILRDCAARGVRVFDITGPDDDWKLKWTSDDRRVNDYYVFKGRMGSLARAMRFGIRPALGRLLRPRGGTVTRIPVLTA
jgi:CelD/BcsL family acetyltransferase involved in cellulose biosynthesis